MRKIINSIENIKITERHLYFFIFFIVYGVYGAGTDLNSDWNLTFLLLPILFIPLTLFFFKQNEVIVNFKDILSAIFYKKNLLILIFLTVLLFFLSYEKIILSITDDENAYTTLALMHSNFIIKKISSYEIFSNLNVSTIYQTLSLILIFSIIIFFYLLNYFIKNNNFLKIIIITLVVLVLRYIIQRSMKNMIVIPFSQL